MTSIPTYAAPANGSILTKCPVSLKDCEELVAIVDPRKQNRHYKHASIFLLLQLGTLFHRLLTDLTEVGVAMERKRLIAFFRRVEKQALALCETLGLPTDPNELYWQSFEEAAAWPSARNVDGLRWLIGGYGPGSIDTPFERDRWGRSRGVIESTESVNLSDTEKMRRFSEGALGNKEFILRTPKQLAALIFKARSERDYLMSLVPKNSGMERLFLKVLFERLVSIHYQVFGWPPQLKDNDRLPEGQGVIWADRLRQNDSRRDRYNRAVKWYVCKDAYHSIQEASDGEWFEEEEESQGYIELEVLRS
jgi:hypothetical protein